MENISFTVLFVCVVVSVARYVCGCVFGCAFAHVGCWTRPQGKTQTHHESWFHRQLPRLQRSQYTTRLALLKLHHSNSTAHQHSAQNNSHVPRSEAENMLSSFEGARLLLSSRPCRFCGRRDRHQERRARFDLLAHYMPRIHVHVRQMSPSHFVNTTTRHVGYCGRNVDVCDHNDNRDLTRNPVRILLCCHVIQSSGSRTSLRDQCFLFAFVRIVSELRCPFGFGTTAASGDP